MHMKYMEIVNVVCYSLMMITLVFNSMHLSVQTGRWTCLLVPGGAYSVFRVIPANQPYNCLFSKLG